MRNGMRLVAAAACCLLPAAAALGDLVVLEAAKDNTLYEDSLGMTSNGSGSYFFAGRTAQELIRRGLIGFDLSEAIPAGSTITGVSLTLHMSRTVAGDIDVALHRVLQDWGEGASDASGQEGGGDAAREGDATWLHTSFSGDFWNTPGGDFDPVSLALTTVGQVGSYTWDSTEAFVALAQEWVDDPTANYGLLLAGDETGIFTTKRFDSRENVIPDFRPRLTVEFLPVPGPSGLGFLSLGLLTPPRRRK